MSPRRILCASALAIAALAIVLSVLAWNSRRLARNAARRIGAMALPGAKTPRPVHVSSPLSGSFGEHLARPLQAFEIAFEKMPLPPGESFSALCGSGVRGETSIAELPQLCRSLLDLERLNARQVLRATHAELGGLPPSLQVGGLFGKDGWSGIINASNVATLDLWDELEKGNTEHALAICLDLVALGREARMSGYLLGLMLGVSFDRKAFGPCSIALTRASNEEKKATALALRIIRDSTPGVSQVLETEGAWSVLSSCGRLLDPVEREALSPEARYIIDSTESNIFGASLLGRLFEPFARGPVCSAFERHYADVGRAALMESPARDRALDTLDVQKGWMSWLRVYPTDVGKFVRRDDEARAAINRLIVEADPRP
jgi:hypothetical protein